MSLKSKLKARIATRHRRYRSWQNAAKSVVALRKRLARKAGGPTVMYDAITVENIPANAPAVAGYVGGKWRTFPTLAAKFPHARRLSIAVASTQDAECVDCENGDVPPELVPGWVKRQLARGVKLPKVYASVSQWPELERLLNAAGLKRGKHYKRWSAHYSHVPHRCTSTCAEGFTGTADATQWTNRALGRDLDESLLSRDFFA